MMSKFSAVFKDFTLGYNHHPAIHHLNAELRKGSLTAVMGPNGSGKSTLLKGIAGLIRPMSGYCSVDKGQRIALLPQRCEINSAFPAPVKDLVELGLWHETGFFGCISQAQRQKVSSALEKVGLSGFESRTLDTLSGGQVQRALFARVFVQNADLILLDEPFNGLDSQCLEQILAILRAWHEEGRTIMVVLHDIDLAYRFFPETMLLARHLVAWGKTREVLQPQKILSAHGFSEAWIEHAPWCENIRNRDHPHIQQHHPPG